MPKLSVIVPAYNVEKYISECIDSIISSTFKDFELILINDGSTDRTAAICDEYALRDDRIKVIHQENRGVSTARNYAIKLCQGEYISFIDSDDYIDDRMFEKLLALIISKNLDIVKCGYSNVNNGNVYATKNFKRREIYTGKSMIEFSMRGSLFTVIWNAIYKKELVEKVMFPENMVYEDVFFSGMVLYYARSIELVNEVLYFYRNNPSSIVNKEVVTNRPLDYLLALSMLHEELIRQGLDDDTVYKFIKRRMSGRLYSILKKSSYKVKMSRGFYELMCENVKLSRRLKFFWYRKLGRIILLQ